MYLADGFSRSKHAGIGGPNIAPAGDGVIAEAVSRSPGNPTHVLMDDRLAEHLPGCNMAFRTQCLRAIGGFDPPFRSAGHDVDGCWRLPEPGCALGYVAGATGDIFRSQTIGRADASRAGLDGSPAPDAAAGAAGGAHAPRPRALAVVDDKQALRVAVAQDVLGMVRDLAKRGSTVGRTGNGSSSSR